MRAEWTKVLCGRALERYMHQAVPITDALRKKLESIASDMQSSVTRYERSQRT